jgi:hypothetical protein
MGASDLIAALLKIDGYSEKSLYIFLGTKLWLEPNGSLC